MWIPRYSYKVWQYTGVSDVGQEREIEIKFVKNNVKELATGNDQWYTHPAFMFGDKELDGFWVGKFETAPNASSACNNSSKNCNNIDESPRILPNIRSITNQTISNQFQTALKFSGGSMVDNVVSFIGSNIYGLTISTDSHMMKNSEWGAVAYLSHSKYGINTEIRENNFVSNVANELLFLTGCGADTVNANMSTTVTTCAIPYGTPSDETYTYPQSTTGNISGIFDMSGGAGEHVMGNYLNMPSYGDLTSAWFTNNTKYYDRYLRNSYSQCTFSRCGGHALNETYRWYSNYSVLPGTGTPWCSRGHLFGIQGSNGADSQSSFRVVLANVES